MGKEMVKALGRAGQDRAGRWGVVLERGAPPLWLEKVISNSRYRMTWRTLVLALEGLTTNQPGELGKFLYCLLINEALNMAFHFLFRF